MPSIASGTGLPDCPHIARTPVRRDGSSGTPRRLGTTPAARFAVKSSAVLVVGDSPAAIATERVTRAFTELLVGFE